MAETFSCGNFIGVIRMILKNCVYLIFIGAYLLLAGCSSSSSPSGLGTVSTNYPILTSKPQVSFQQSVTDSSKYDVTVTVTADGPNGVSSIGLWLHSKDDSSVFEHLDLTFIGGNTWEASTYFLLPLPAGNYYIDSILIEDTDPNNNDLVKSSWYILGLLSTTHYSVDQRLTDWNPASFEIIESNFATSNITNVNFTLP